MKPQILDEAPMNIVEVRESLQKIQKRDGELSFRANKTLDYLNEFTLLKPKEAQELQKKIEDLKIPRLKDVHVHKIISVMPKYMEDLKVVLQGYTLTVKDDHLKKVLDVLAQYH